MRKAFRILVAVALAMTGCVSNISHDSRYGTDYVVGDVYRVREPLFADIGAGTIFGNFNDPTLTVAGTRRGDLPSSTQEYEQDPHRWRNIAGVIVPGTKLRIEKIELERNPENGRTIWVKAQILDGALAGKKHAELHFISLERRNEKLVVDVPMVDTSILERVQ
jgi:hypothetical protein